jgi:hypothetical protein
MTSFALLIGVTHSVPAHRPKPFSGLRAWDTKHATSFEREPLSFHDDLPCSSQDTDFDLTGQ